MPGDQPAQPASKTSRSSGRPGGPPGLGSPEEEEAAWPPTVAQADRVVSLSKLASPGKVDEAVDRVKDGLVGRPAPPPKALPCSARYSAQGSEAMARGAQPAPLPTDSKKGRNPFLYLRTQSSRPAGGVQESKMELSWLQSSSDCVEIVKVRQMKGNSYH